MIRKFLQGALPVGVSIYLVSRVCSQSFGMANSLKNVLIRVSGVLMIVGIIYFGWCLGRKRNPFRD